MGMQETGATVSYWEVIPCVQSSASRSDIPQADDRHVNEGQESGPLGQVKCRVPGGLDVVGGLPLIVECQEYDGSPPSLLHQTLLVLANGNPSSKAA